MCIEDISGLDRNRQPDLVLVNSPLRNYDDRPKDNYEILPPLGLAYIATFAKTKGYNVGVLDAEHLGMGRIKLAGIINNLRSRYVGINVLTPTINESLHFARDLDDDRNLVIGGPHATARPKETLLEFTKLHKKTILIAHEGELPIAALLDKQPWEVIPNGYWLNADGEIKGNPMQIVKDLDTLPVLERRFLINDPSVDSITGMLESKVLTSRGCPFNCTFCAGAREVNPLNAIVRRRSPERIAEEIHDLVFNYGCNQIRFVDDLFISSGIRVKSILEAIKQSGVRSLSWDATGRANILANFDYSLLDYLKDNGAHEIAMGIESGSERLRRRVNKQVTEEQIKRSIYELTKRGIHVKGYFIIGLPTETEAETMDTVKMAKDLTEAYDKLFRVSMFIFRPYPGTKEWADLTRQGYSAGQLLSMHAVGVGERAKHEITTSQRFGDLSPEDLTQLLYQYNHWQDEYYRTH